MTLNSTVYAKFAFTVKPLLLKPTNNVKSSIVSAHNVGKGSRQGQLFHVVIATLGSRQINAKAVWSGGDCSVPYVDICSLGNEIIHHICLAVVCSVMKWLPPTFQGPIYIFSLTEEKCTLFNWNKLGTITRVPMHWKWELSQLLFQLHAGTTTLIHCPAMKETKIHS